MSSPLISVIVPIYNMGPLLPRCLDSLAAQTLRDLEIICVDDGSTDGSGDIGPEICFRRQPFPPDYAGKFRQGGSPQRGNQGSRGALSGFCGSG